MEVQQILQSKEKLIDFLQEKGLQEEKDYPEEEYKEGIYFKINKRKLLVVYEIFDEEKLKEVKDHFLIDRGLSYCIIIFNQKLIFFRNFGDTKHFIYSERTKDKISKVDRIKNIDKEGFDFIFQAGKDISQQFYDSFKLKRDLLASSIKTDMEPTQKYLIAQKIFDRFFFIYFLCHKKLVKANNRNISGKNLFSEILLKQKEFLPNLKNLFDKFNLQGKNESRILKIDNYELFIPYLNGGLFRPDVLEEDLKISLSNKQWSEIFDFLNSYHWIIEDIRSLDDIEESEQDHKKEGYLTPEILGHVYERSVVEWEQKGFDEEAKKAVNKISERKKKGVYYTPEAITDYISNNTIIHYLLNKLDKKYSDFDLLVESKNKDDIKKAISVLDSIKVLDPACGSGAFLIKSSEILFHLKRRLNYVLGNKKDFYSLKLNIVTDSIYGVDILKGATEISKLRLWLWLISDYEMEEDVEPLPNIEYNLMCGNSLVGFTSFKGKLVEVSSKLISKTKRFEELKSEYKKSHGKTSVIIQELLEKEMTSVRSELNSLYIQDLNSRGIDIFKVKKDTQFNFFGEKAKTKDDKYIYQEQFEKELLPFHWVLEFSEVFKGETPGFDVVIGNPPYATNYAKHSTKIKQQTIDLLKVHFNFSITRKINRYNLVMFFLERNIHLSKKEALVSMIIDGSGFYTTVYTEIRKELIENSKIKELVDNLDVFEGVNTKQIILTYVNIKEDSNYKILWRDGIKGELQNIESIYWKSNSEFNFLKPNSDLELIEHIDKWEILDNNFSPISGMNVTNRPESGLKPFLSEERINDKYHKAIFSGNISAFNLKYPTKEQLNETSRKLPYICFDKNLGYEMNEYLAKIGEKARVSLGKTDERYKQPKLFVRQSLSGKNLIECAYSDDFDFYCDNSVYVINSFQKSKHELLYLMLVLNSKIVTFYAKEKEILSKASAGSATRLPIGSNRGKGLKDIPIPFNEHNLFLFKLSEMLITLYEKEDENLDNIEFILNLKDYCIYEIYLKEKLQTNLLDKIKPLIKYISEIKDDSKKLQVIEEFIKKVEESKEIQAELEKIKTHPWVKVIESKNEK
jgi:hypothetical protein